MCATATATCSTDEECFDHWGFGFVCNTSTSVCGYESCSESADCTQYDEGAECCYGWCEEPGYCSGFSSTEDYEFSSTEYFEPSGTEDFEPSGTEDYEFSSTEDFDPSGTEDFEPSGTEEIVASNMSTTTSTSTSNTENTLVDNSGGVTWAVGSAAWCLVVAAFSRV